MFIPLEGREGRQGWEKGIEGWRVLTVADCVGMDVAGTKSPVQRPFLRSGTIFLEAEILRWASRANSGTRTLPSTGLNRM
jgi:hypothetical protein